MIKQQQQPGKNKVPIIGYPLNPAPNPLDDRAAAKMDLLFCI